MTTVFSIGHSAHAIDTFVALLRQHDVSAIADVRSHPYSRRLPQFSKAELQAALKAEGLHYVFLGRELGARREERESYVDGRARYDLIAQLPAFGEGIDRVIKGAGRLLIALMCAEKDPLTCHRTILVSRALQARGITVQHILDDGRLESHAAAEERLLLEEGFTPGQFDMFGGSDDKYSLTLAYARRGEKIAFQEEETDNEAVHDRLHAEKR